MYEFKFFNFNNFLNTFQSKKEYMKNYKEKVFFFKSKNDYEKTKLKKIQDINFIIIYLVSIVFSSTNARMHITTFSGKSKYFYSSGFFKYAGRSKSFRMVVLKKFYKLIVTQLKFLCDRPVALNLINVGSAKSWIIKKLRKRLFIRVIRSFNYRPHNGCRQKKVIRKKFKTKK